MALTESVKIWGKRSTERIQAAYYNHLSKKAAFQALRQIEKEKGRLSESLLKTADAYAHDVLGGKVFAPWLYVYTAIAGGFKEGWIPDNYYHLMVIPKIQGDYGKISFLKPLNRKFFGGTISPDIAFFINGEWYDEHYLRIDRAELTAISFVENERVVYKADQSYQGKGIFIRIKDDFDVGELEKKGNGTLQRYIKQHTFFSDFHFNSVSSIRMTTIMNVSGECNLRAAYLRLGRANDTHVKSDSHVRVPIDLVSGELYDKGYLTNWQTIGRHPDSLIPFSKKIIPEYQSCIQMVLKLHSNFPMVKSIGWDITVDRNNRPVLMEWNGYGNDIKFSEATQGPCFKDLGWDGLRS